MRESEFGVCVECSSSGGNGGPEHNLDLSLGGSSSRRNNSLDFRDNSAIQEQQQQQQYPSSMQLELNWQNQGSRPKVRDYYFATNLPIIVLMKLFNSGSS